VVAIYKCPKCGRTVKLVYRPGLLYSCKVCGPDVHLDFVEFEIKEKEPIPEVVGQYWVFTVPELEFLGSVSSYREAKERAVEYLKSVTEPTRVAILKAEKFIDAE